MSNSKNEKNMHSQLTIKLRAMRQELRPITSSSRQLVSALAGLNKNISGLRSQMQANHSEVMGVVGRITAALEANVSVVRAESQLEPEVLSEGVGRVLLPSKPPEGN